MSYTAGIEVMDFVEFMTPNNPENPNAKPTFVKLTPAHHLEGVKEFDYLDYYVSGRKDLHYLFGQLSQANMYCDNSKGYSFIKGVFNRPDLDGLKYIDYLDEGTTDIKMIGKLVNVDFYQFRADIEYAIKEHQEEGQKRKEETEKANAQAIALRKERINEIREFQLKAPDDDTFNRFQNQIDRLYQEISELEDDELLSYYNSSDYDDDFGAIERVREILRVAELAIKDGKVVLVYGE